MESEKGPSLFNADKVVTLLFVGFLFSPQAQDLLYHSGLRWAYLLLLSFGLANLSTPIVHWVAYKTGAVDIPKGRKAHDAPTALLGGVAVFLAFAVTVLYNFSFSEELKGVVLGGMLIFVVGLVDDLREIPASIKLVAQLVAVAILVQHGVVISFLPDQMWGNVGEWALTAFWVIGITNAINFLDGMDGLAAGICGIISIFFALVALQNHQDYMVYLAVPLVGACLGFLPYNFRISRPAAIFLGDAGSTFLGFTVAALGVMGEWAGDHGVRLIVPVLILGVPIFDMTFTTFMRVKSGEVRSLREWIDYTGRDHIHHRLAGLRIGKRNAVLVIYVVTLWLGLSALALENATGLNALLQVAQSVIVFLLLGFFMVFVQHKYEEIEHDELNRRSTDTK
ncbi:MAG: UDP-GlcNAc:undecaprenyl-phosphate GlcNAc-1-phosphate transferase [Candidatus Latescibacterota bacterium]